MEKIYNIDLNEIELNYLKNVVSSLIRLQKKIPKRMQTKNSEVLYMINKKLLDV